MEKTWDLPPHLQDHTYCKTDRKAKATEILLLLILDEQQEEQHGQLVCPSCSAQLRARFRHRRRKRTRRQRNQPEQRRKRSRRRVHLRRRRERHRRLARPGNEERDNSAWSAPRPTSTQFFPKLEDLSLRAEVEERRWREAEQQQNLRALDEQLDERFILNPAILPDWRPPVNLEDTEEAQDEKPPEKRTKH